MEINKHSRYIIVALDLDIVVLLIDLDRREQKTRRHVLLLLLRWVF